MELVAQDNVYRDIPDSGRKSLMEIIDPDGHLVGAAAVWNVFSVDGVSYLGEQRLECSEYVLVCSLRAPGALRAAAQMVAEDDDGQETERAGVFFELQQMGD